MSLRGHTVRVNSGKYTFNRPAGDYRVNALRYGEPWIDDLDGGDAMHALMCELDAARVVLAAARASAAAGELPMSLRDALDLHDRLVDDHEPPSDWTMPAAVPR